MRTIKIEISDHAFEKVMYLLKNLPKQDVKVISHQGKNNDQLSETNAFASHSASLVEDWKDDGEDEIWI